MSTRVHPSKYYVPELPDEYIGHFGEHSNTTEANVIRLLLETDTSTSPTPAIAVKGVGGAGKTTVLVAVGHHETACARFTDALWFIVLGRDANPSQLLENLEEVVRSVVGESKADEIARLSRLQDKSSAVAEAIRVLKEHDVLLLLDDVWADQAERVVGQSTVYSLIRDCLRRVQRNPGRLRVIVSTRDAGVAALVAEPCRVDAGPFKARDPSAREMLCRYAQVSVEDIETSSSMVQESFNSVLDRCGGLPLALAVAGSVVCERNKFGGVGKDEVWGLYADEHKRMPAFLKQPGPQADHPGLYAMVESSLKWVGSYLRRVGFQFCDEVKLLLSLLGVLRKQEAVPLSVAECIWGLSKEEALQLCTTLARMHLVSLTEEKGVRWMRVHDVIIDFCRVVLTEKPGRKSVAHCGTVDRLEKMMLVPNFAGRAEDGGAGCADWWELGDAGLDKWTRDYCLRNLARHKVEAGEEYTQRLLYLISDYRWTETQMQLSKQGNSLNGIVGDVQILVTGCCNELDGDVKQGVELIADAARLSTQYVADNPQELPYQLQGRLAEHSGKNSVVDYFLWTIDKYAARPWLKATRGVLKAAGGPVVLSASLPKQLVCVAFLPNGEDVVVGGEDGYLVVFSTRYASKLYELCGHDGSVLCVVACAATRRVFSAGRDGTIRAWELGTAQQASDVLVRHGRSVCSLAVMADGSTLVFGDEEGWMVVCDTTSGNQRCKWRAHSSVVSSLAIRREDEMIVSGSYDGTIARWESASGDEIGSRLAVGGMKVYCVVVSQGGKWIGFAGQTKVGVLGADNGDVIRECGTYWRARGAVFGLDGETVHFARNDGTTAALTPNDDDDVWDVKAHNRAVWGIAQSHESQLLVSVSRDCTLSVQNLDRANTSRAKDPNVHNLLRDFFVFPDRRRILYSWWNGPRGLRFLNLDAASLGTSLSNDEFMGASTIIGSAEAAVSAITVSRDGRCAVAGTLEGEILVHATDTWRPRYANLRRLPGAVWSAAISGNGTFFAVGSDRGGVSLFRLADGSEVLLPSSAGLDGITMKVAFNEENTSLFAMVRNKSQRAGMLHVWRHIDRAADISHIALPFDRISPWDQPWFSMSVLSSSSHFAIREPVRTPTFIYDFSCGQYSSVSYEEQDSSGFLQVSNREHAALELEGSLFMAPFGRKIRYCQGSDSVVLGTLETAICHSFRPGRWTFDSRAGIFIAGCSGSKLVTAVLMREEAKLLLHKSSVPKLPLVHKSAALRVDSTSAGTRPSHYSVFISHAGPDKHDIAIPLYRRLAEKGVTAFVDKEELRPGDQAPREMEMAMETADIGVFVTSPEFVCRWWPMKELSCFLRRTVEDEAKSRNPPTVLPVFYRLGVHECRRPDLFNKPEMIQAAADEGFFSVERQQKMSIQKVSEHLRGLAGFTGIENEEDVVNDVDFRMQRTDSRMGRMENRVARDRLLKQILDAVLEVQARKRLSTGDSGRDRGGVEAEKVNTETGSSVAVVSSRKRVAREQDSGKTESGEAVNGERKKRLRFCTIA